MSAELLDAAKAQLLLDQGILKDSESFWSEEKCPNCDRFLRTDGHYLWCVYRKGHSERHPCSPSGPKRRRRKRK